MNKQQIGRSGELLVQYKLLLHGIESAPMTTDYGIDIIAYSSRTNHALTIQVKTNEKPKKAGGKGKLALGWWLADDSPADLIAFVDLSSNSVWLFRNMEVAKYSQQHSTGKYQFYMYVDSQVAVKHIRPVFLNQFADFMLEKRISNLF
ncbi:MAG: hypothetical protein NTX44_13900 [Ignavibacteriales bacterium]|nr:hypothetical protein [Ignavibacteriales bacterium]